MKRLFITATLCLLAAAAHAETYYRVALPGGARIEMAYAPCVSVRGAVSDQYNHARYFDARGRSSWACWGQANTGEFVVVTDKAGTYSFYPYELERLQR